MSSAIAGMVAEAEADRRKEIDAALKAYRAAVGKLHAGAELDAKEKRAMVAAMGVLRVTEADVAADLKALREQDNIRANLTILRGKGANTDQALNAVSAEVRKLEDQLREARKRQAAAMHDLQQYGFWRGEQPRHMSDHPRLFGDGYTPPDPNAPKGIYVPQLIRAS